MTIRATSALLAKQAAAPAVDPALRNVKMPPAFGAIAPPVIDFSKLRLERKDEESLLDETNREKLHRLISANPQDILEKKPNPDIIYHVTKDTTAVFELPKSFPGLIIKSWGGNLQIANQNKSDQDKGREFLSKKRLQYCYAPRSEVFIIDQIAFLVSEKAIGSTNKYESRNLREEEYQLFDSSPDIRAKWKVFTQQGAEAIVGLGYWDTGDHNILHDSSAGLGFIDWENVKPSLENEEIGLKRWIEMAHPDFYDDICAIGKQYGVDLTNETNEAAKQKRREEMRFRARIKAFHEKRGITSASPFEPIDTSSFPAQSFERKILDECNDYLTLEDGARSSCLKGILIEQRKKYWAPFCSDLFKCEERGAFEAALKHLQKNGSICDWTIQDISANWKEGVIYEIYF